MPVLVLITRIIHRIHRIIHRIQFCNSSKHTLLKYQVGKTGRNGTGRHVESVEHMEQYHIKFGDKSHNLN